MATRKRNVITEMQVISSGLEPELKERLRKISGEQGYQALIREVLWNFVEQQMVLDEVRSMPLELWRFCDGAATAMPLSNMACLKQIFEQLN